MSPEERIVRAAYEKLTRLNKAARFTKGVAARRSADDGLALRFELSNFRVGPIQEIWGTPARDLATLPSGEIINLQRVVTQLNKGLERVAYEAEWTDGQYASLYDQRWTIGDLFGFQPATYYDVGGYALYEVTLFFQGKSRTYRALALFHNPYKSAESLKPQFWDHIVGMAGGLTDVWNEKRSVIGHESNPSTEEDAPAAAPDAAPLQVASEQDGGQAVSATESYSTSGPLDAIPDPNTQDMKEHKTGAHGQTVRFHGNCYEQSDNQQLCTVDMIFVHTYENGQTSNWLYNHVNKIDVKKESASGPRGIEINCVTGRGIATSRCLDPGCNFSVALQGSGANMSMTGGNLWNGQLVHKHYCKLPSSTSGCTTASFDGGCPFGTYPNGFGMCCSGTTCNGTVAAPTTASLAPEADGPAPNLVEGGGGDGCACDSVERMDCMQGGGEWLEYSCACVSPVLVDLDGDGFDLTDGAGGVAFDFTGDGTPELMSWTTAGSDDSWLFLDRNGNGMVDNGQELFGTSTPQPAPAAGEGRNGFTALAVYDLTGNGGNGDGVIDARDAIYASLRLWCDVNHNGVSEVGELQTLPAADVVGLHLDYRESKRTDEHGNRFRFRARVEDARGARVGRWAWDIFPVKPR